MSDHEFENRVKQKMDELRFTPSDAVWNKVAGELRKDRPRRRGWVLLPLLAIGLGAGGYFFYQKNLASDNNTTLTSNEIKTPSTAADAGNQPLISDPNSSSAGQPAAGEPALREPVNSTALNPATNGAGNDAGISAGGKKLPSATGGALQNKSAVADYEPPGIASNDGVKANNNEGVTTKKDQHDGATANNKIGGATADNKARLTEKKTGTKHSQTAETKNGETPGPKNPTVIENNSTAGTENNKTGTENNKTAGTEKNAGVDKKGLDLTNKNIAAGNKVTGTIKQDPIADNTLADSTEIAVADKKLADADKTADTDKTAEATESPAVKRTDLSKVNVPMTEKKVANNKSRSSKWEWGVNASVGLSALNNGIVRDLLKSTPSADAAALPQASNNALFAPPSPMGVPPARASSVKAGVQFTVGGFVKKQLNKTFAVTAGLQYSQYNNVIRVGYRVDSSRLVNNGREIRNVATYYRGDEKTKFSNTYHFIELPLTLHTQLNKSTSTPLYWNAGITLTRLIGSDALLFDSGTGVYYRDDSKQNKTQFAVGTGFSIGLLSKSRTPLSIGPGLRYNITSLYNDDLKSEKHLLTGSIDLRMFINNKNKSVQRK